MMSNFCTAAVESYCYYNQCRTMARCIANEKCYLIDEHVILKTFQGVSVAEANLGNKNANNDDVSLKYIMEFGVLIQVIFRILQNKSNTDENRCRNHSNKYLKIKVKSIQTTNINCIF